MTHPFSDADLALLRARGIDLEEGLRQLRLLETPPAPIRLDRPATVGDGIDVVSESEVPALLQAHAAAARDGRISKFVPASGAATRMFRDLLACREGRAQAGERAHGQLHAFLAELPRFAFYGDLSNELARRGLDLDELARDGEYLEILDALLGAEGLGYADLPKGALKFHRHPRCPRTPLEEHLVEAVETVRDAAGVCRVHFTVSAEHRFTFASLYESVRSVYETLYGVLYEVDFSIQEPSSDTLAVELDCRPFRDDTGALVFRPGGHGALLGNLDALRGDVVLVRNIDNVMPEERSESVFLWKKVVAGILVSLQRDLFSAIARLGEREARASRFDDARDLLRARLHLEPPAGFDDRTVAERKEWLLGTLRRPLRVCGVVRNTGEPGGGPFWTRDAGGERSLQIVESAQVDQESAEQRAVLGSASHFNPVDLVCGVRDENGEPHDLSRWVDPDAIFLTRKSHGGRELVALERPGLWNGAMARWNTVFVEVPGSTFAPVKELNDLLRPEHRSGRR
jgi:hypothetical protein